MATLFGFTTINVDNAYCVKHPVYLGEYCWQAEDGFLRIGITHMGDKHLFGCGSATGPAYKFAINGNFEVDGSSVLLTFTDSASFYEDTFMQSRVGNAILDIDTLDGKANFMVMKWENEACSLEHYSMDVTSVPCDGSQSRDGVDKIEKLKTLLKSFVTTPEEKQDREAQEMPDK
jgi:hypothetical protein